MEHIKQIVGDIQFRETRNTYLVGEKLPCKFNVLSERKPEAGDWIGIYPVGWTQMTDFKVRQYISAELIEQSRVQKLENLTVVFEPSELPKETCLSYVFVYVTRTGIVRGVSLPFRLETVVPEQFRNVQGEYTRYPTSLIEYFLGGQYEPMFRSSLKAEPVAERVVEPVAECVVEPVAETKKEWIKPEIKEEELLSTLWQRVMTLPSSKEEQYRLTQELLVENMRLRSTLESKTEEILNIKKSHDELSMVNGELLSKLNTLEKRIEDESVERETFIHKVFDALKPIIALHPERIAEAETLLGTPKSE